MNEKLLSEIMKYYGLKEVDGPSNNRELIELIKTVIPWATDDSKISWCAIFITYIFKQLGWDKWIPDNPAGARNWLKIKGHHTMIWKQGDDVDQISRVAKPGYIVIFSRGNVNSWEGHIAVYVNEFHNDRKLIRVLGGNQDNTVSIRAYQKEKVLGIIKLEDIHGSDL